MAATYPTARLKRGDLPKLALRRVELGVAFLGEVSQSRKPDIAPPNRRGVRKAGLALAGWGELRPHRKRNPIRSVDRIDRRPNRMKFGQTKPFLG